MNLNFLSFEQPIAEVEAKLDELKRLVPSESVEKEIAKLRQQNLKLTESIFSSLTPWQITQLARHPQRPYTNDYISLMVTDYYELFGDRMYANDFAIVAGMGRLQDIPVMVIGHQKGRDTESRNLRNFGMPKPEGYRKAQRLMKMAEKFSMPILTFIDTPGAYPGVGAEERGQSAAIAESLKIMTRLKTPIISTVIGEGGSGGALAIGVCDTLLMLQYSTYSVISPEGCASILWKSADKAADAATAMGMTSDELLKRGLIDSVVQEPPGGAHRDPAGTAETLKGHLLDALSSLKLMPVDDLLKRRVKRLNSYSQVSQ